MSSADSRNIAKCLKSLDGPAWDYYVVQDIRQVLALDLNTFTEGYRSCLTILPFLVVIHLEGIRVLAESRVRLPQIFLNITLQMSGSAETESSLVRVYTHIDSRHS